MDFKELYEKWQNEKYFVIDGDRIKEKCFVFSSFPTSNLYGFQNGKIRSAIAGDLLARYHRLQNRNVLFPVGFNTLSQSAFIESRKSSNALTDDISNLFYNQLLRLGIGAGILKDVVLWGITDKMSWKNNFPAPGRGDAPLLFDVEGKEKPAFYKLLNM